MWLKDFLKKYSVNPIQTYPKSSFCETCHEETDAGTYLCDNCYKSIVKGKALDGYFIISNKLFGALYKHARSSHFRWKYNEDELYMLAGTYARFIHQILCDNEEITTSEYSVLFNECVIRKNGYMLLARSRGIFGDLQDLYDDIVLKYSERGQVYNLSIVLAEHFLNYIRALDNYDNIYSLFLEVSAYMDDEIQKVLNIPNNTELEKYVNEYIKCRDTYWY